MDNVRASYLIAYRQYTKDVVMELHENNIPKIPKRLQSMYLNMK